MTNQTTCPHCGAPQIPANPLTTSATVFSCGTFIPAIGTREPYRSKGCLMAELAAQAATIARLTELVLKYRRLAFISEMRNCGATNQSWIDQERERYDARTAAMLREATGTAASQDADAGEEEERKSC